MPLTTKQLVKPAYINLKPGARSSESVDILCFGESPGVEEASQDEAFVGQAGRLLRRILEAEFPDKSICLDNVCPEVLNGGHGKPVKKIMEQYQEYRENSVKKHSPRVIIALGGFAMHALGEPGSVIRKCGSVSQFQGKPTVICVHPSFVLRTKLTRLDLIKKAMSVAKGLFRRKSSEIPLCLISSSKELSAWLDKRATTLCGFDLETSTLRPTDDHAMILSVGISDGKETIYTPILHPDHYDELPLTKLKIISKWWPKGPRVVHNCKFELLWMREAAGAEDPAVLYDTLLESWLINENESKGLDYLWCSVLRKKPYWLDLPLDSSQMSSVSYAVLGPYNAMDAYATWKLHDFWEEELKDREGFYRELILPFAKLLVTIQQRGIKLDLVVLENVIREMEKTALKLYRKVSRSFPGVNFKSPKQLSRLLFKDLRLPVTHRTEKGTPSTRLEAINHLARINRKVLPLAQVRRLESRLAREARPLLIVQRRGFVHTEYNFGDIVTGRLSSSKPNLQNISKTSEHRIAFVSRFKWGVLLIADYSQHELRIAATISGEREFLKLWEKDIHADVHQATADALKCDRFKAKNINFSLIYDISPEGLEEKYGIRLAEAVKLKKEWRHKYPKIVAYHAQCREDMRTRGYVENLFGRRRHLSNTEDAHEVRQAYNFPIQSTAVDLCYLAMLSIEKRLRKGEYHSMIVHQIHDSIVVDSPIDEVKRVTKVMEEEMLKCRTRKKIPLSVDIKSQSHL